LKFFFLLFSGQVPDVRAEGVALPRRVRAVFLLIGVVREDNLVGAKRVCFVIFDSTGYVVLRVQRLAGDGEGAGELTFGVIVRERQILCRCVRCRGGFLSSLLPLLDLR
jgi:hypothetical protein